MIAEIISILQKGNFYGAGECTEIAKGKHEITTKLKDGLNKIYRLWLSKK